MLPHQHTCTILMLNTRDNDTLLRIFDSMNRGDDFRFVRPEMAFKNMGKVLSRIKSIHKSNITFRYCTVSEYFESVQNELKTIQKPLVRTLFNFISFEPFFPLFHVISTCFILRQTLIGFVKGGLFENS